MPGLIVSTLIRSQLEGTLPMRRATVKEELRWFPGAPGLELSTEGGWKGKWWAQLNLWALTWQTCYARLSPGPGGPAHTGQNTV